MGWTRKGPEKGQHFCHKPKIRFWTKDGSQWRCDECGWFWEVVIISNVHDRFKHKDWKLIDSRGWL